MEPLACDHLVQTLYQPFAALPDCRKGKPNQYAITDAALGAFAVFLTQPPSFLVYQRTMRPAQGRSHANSLLGMGEIPWDTQIRTLLNPIDPAQLFPVFEGVYEALERSAQLGSCRAFAGQWLIAFAGPE